MSEHIDLEIGDFLADRLPAARRVEIVSHLERCSDCAGQTEWARRLQEEALRDDAPHVTPERIVEISEGGLESGTGQERDHLTWCAGCSEDMEWAKRTPMGEAASGGEVATDPPASGGSARRRRRPWRWFMGLGLAAAAGTAAVVLMLLAPGGADLAGLARIEPLPVQLTRSGSGSTPFEQSRIDGLEKYRDGDYAGARESMAAAVQLNPGDAETRLYLGSSLLMLGDPRSAAAELGKAVAAAQGAVVLEESLWQLAQASLAAGDREGAERALVRLAGEQGRHGREAADQLARLRGRAE